MEFQCSACGICCKKVGQAVKKAREESALRKGNVDARTKAVAKFPFKTNAEGACSKLDENGKCTVYETRPDVCRVDKSFELFAKPHGISQAQFFEANAKLCNSWIRKAGMGMEYLVTENYS